MKEIISIHIGSSGINPGKEYWKLKSYENGIGEDGVLTNKSDKSELNSYFFETNKGEYKARALFVDIDSNTTEDLKNFEMQNIFSNEMIFNPLSVPVTCWAGSYYTTGKDIINKVVDTFTSHAETCDSLEGIQLFYSLHGAYSSGFGSLVNNKLSEAFGDKFRIHYNSFPGFNSNVFEYYNCLLSINKYFIFKIVNVMRLFFMIMMLYTITAKTFKK
jgi:tubulin alpha